MLLTTEQATALEDSIAHWKRMREMPHEQRRHNWTYGNGEAPNADHCELCRQFCTVSPLRCQGCPVFSATGNVRCDGTPFTEALIAFSQLDDVWHPAADAEIAFLESLRDPAHAALIPAATSPDTTTPAP